MPRAGALNQRAGSSGKQFSDAVGALFQLCIERAYSDFMLPVKESVITHYNQILVGNAVSGNAQKSAS